VAIGAVIAIVASGDNETPAAGIEQTRPVTIDGEPLPELTDSPTDPAVGQTAPTLTGAGFDGTPISVAPGNPTVLVFLAHWCPHCQREVPVLTEWAGQGGVPDGVDVIGIATATNADRPNYPPSQWLQREQFPFPVIADNETYDAATAFGLSGFPFFVVLDSEGKVVERASGELDPTTLTAMLAELN
jgi:thiol-disulfide isomerase/thioredoxin